MAVLHDYFCSQHGVFESFSEKCPMKPCKGEVSRVFLQPVGIKSDRTKKADKALKQLASDFKMTDIKSTREGEHQTGYIKRNNSQTDKERDEALAVAEQRQPRPGDAAIWGGAGAISMGSVMGGQFKPVADEQVSVLPKSVGNLTGPRAASYIADHENLKIKP
jgi:hypothetical protein